MYIVMNIEDSMLMNFDNLIVVVAAYYTSAKYLMYPLINNSVSPARGQWPTHFNLHTRKPVGLKKDTISESENPLHILITGGTTCGQVPRSEPVPSTNCGSDTSQRGRSTHSYVDMESTLSGEGQKHQVLSDTPSPRKRFDDDVEVQEGVTTWLKSQVAEFCNAGISKLVHPMIGAEICMVTVLKHISAIASEQAVRSKRKYACVTVSCRRPLCIKSLLTYLLPGRNKSQSILCLVYEPLPRHPVFRQIHRPSTPGHIFDHLIAPSYLWPTQRAPSCRLLSAFSPSGTSCAVLREFTQPDGGSKKQHLEIWADNRLSQLVDLTLADQHGEVYTSGQ
ncbi:hypothetical protein J6590_098554 [Homalodisca vitripennis]|nr:hypothetical protein J6590_098554 [Homalodisca vitripennis]